MRKILTFLFLSFFFSENTQAQIGTDLTIGQWKQHLPFTKGVYVTQSDDQVFYATGQALLTIDKADRATRMTTKVEGLSGIGVNLVKYNQGSNVLVLAYEDGVIDLLSDEGNITLLNVPESNILLGKKEINDVFMLNDSIAYVAGNFGLTTLNLLNGRFPNTIKIDMGANSVTAWNGNIYVATDDGVYFTDPSEVVNIDDFSNWEWLGDEVGLPPVYSSNALVVYEDKLYMDVSDSLYVLSGNTAEYVHHIDSFSIRYLSADGEHLLAGFRCGTCPGQVLVFNQDHSFVQGGGQCVSQPFYAIEDKSGNIWYADAGSNYRIENAGTGTCAPFSLNSPPTTNIYDIAVGNGEVWVAPGGVDLTFSALYRTDGLFALIGGEWKRYYQWSRSELADIFDYMDVEIDPKTGHVFAGAFLDALVEYVPENDEFIVYNETNSELGLAENDDTRTRVTGLSFDQEGNLWAANNSAQRPLVAFRPDGTSQSFSLSNCTNDIGTFELAVDQLGYKWLMMTNSSTGIVVFDEGEMDDPTDDRCRIINTSNSVLPTNEVNELQVDRDGAIWVGTNLGAVVFQCDPFNGECVGTRPFVTVDGFGANLLEDQNVQAIGVDGANRKWFGTAAGLFIMSPEGNNQIAHLTADNSPLFSSSITAIAFDDELGIAYIGTTEGLISLRTEATGADSFHDSNVLVFPNPVRPGYDGPIAIKGLAENSTVKITDVSGQLVFETEALGGQAIWYGRDYNDRKVNTGVYLVYATSRSSNDPLVTVAKILVVN